MKAKVYFSREITPAKVVELYHVPGITLPGKAAAKLHSGEKGNQSFLRPDFFEAAAALGFGSREYELIKL